MAKAKAAFYQVAESFIGALDGDEVEYHKGEVVGDDDPGLKRWPDSFVELKVREHRRAAVEQATAAPGEQRNAEPQGKAMTVAAMKGRA